jgi:hypothetical protein
MNVKQNFVRYLMATIAVAMQLIILSCNKKPESPEGYIPVIDSDWWRICTIPDLDSTLPGSTLLTTVF